MNHADIFKRLTAPKVVSQVLLLSNLVFAKGRCTMRTEKTVAEMDKLRMKKVIEVSNKSTGYLFQMFRRYGVLIYS